MKKAALERTEQAEQSNTQAAQDWIDYGNIAYLSDSQKALSAYERAIKLDVSNAERGTDQA